MITVTIRKDIEDQGVKMFNKEVIQQETTVLIGMETFQDFIVIWGRFPHSSKCSSRNFKEIIYTLTYLSNLFALWFMPYWSIIFMYTSLIKTGWKTVSPFITEQIYGFSHEMFLYVCVRRLSGSLCLVSILCVLSVRHYISGVGWWNASGILQYYHFILCEYVGFELIIVYLCSNRLRIGSLKQSLEPLTVAIVLPLDITTV